MFGRSVITNSVNSRVGPLVVREREACFLSQPIQEVWRLVCYEAWPPGHPLNKCPRLGSRRRLGLYTHSRPLGSGGICDATTLWRMWWEEEFRDVEAEEEEQRESPFDFEFLSLLSKPKVTIDLPPLLLYLGIQAIVSTVWWFFGWWTLGSFLC